MTKLFNTRPLMAIQDTYAMRGICMIMIMIHHLMKYHNSVNYTMHWGDIATGAFFFLSGYGLYCSITKRDKVDIHYFCQNIKKLVLPFFVCWIFCLLTCIVFFREYFTAGIVGIFRDIFTLTYPMTWPGIWFIKVIVIEYIITILAGIVSKRKLVRLLVPTICTGIYYLIAWKCLHWSPYLYCTTLCYILGLWFAAYKPKLDLKFSTKILGTIIFFALYICFKRFNLHLPVPPLTVYAICFSLFMVFLVSLIDIVNPIFYYIGKNSLLFYLIHIPLLSYVLRLRPTDSFNPNYAFGAMLVITFVLCLLYNKCEEKLDKSKKQKLDFN